MSPRAKNKEMRSALLKYALSLPEAVEARPWGERVAKVGGKVFAFFGLQTDEDVRLGVKLPESRSAALKVGAEPMGYGLGAHDWVWMQLPAAKAPPHDVMCAWIDESFRVVAPKRLAARLASTPVQVTAAPRGRPAALRRRAAPSRKRRI